MKVLLLLVIVVCGIGIMIPNVFAYTISHDSTGGDCTTIGTWNYASKTCILGNNITKTVSIMSNGIIFDGNGKLISIDEQVMGEDEGESGTGIDYTATHGIYINGFDNIAITDVNVNMANVGVFVENSEKTLRCTMFRIPHN